MGYIVKIAYERGYGLMDETMFIDDQKIAGSSTTSERSFSWRSVTKAA
jgi:hypothetical protein